MRSMIQFEPLEGRWLFSVDLLLDAAGLSATSAATIDGMSYFFANNGVVGTELWKSDGTGAGTTLVKDLTPGAESSKPHEAMLRARDRAIFVTVADEGVQDKMGSADYIVWASDGTAKGTVVLARFEKAGNIVAKQVGDRVAFGVTLRSAAGLGGETPITDMHLYFTDGTVAGTTRVVAFLGEKRSEDDYIGYFAGKLVATGNRVLFSPDESRLYSSDGTNSGTVDLTGALGNNYFPAWGYSGMVEAGGKVILPGQMNGTIWITDGTIAGTVTRTFEKTFQGVVEPYSTVVSKDAIYFVTVYGDIKKVW